MKCPYCGEEVTAKPHKAFYCENCEQVVAIDDTTRVYECGSCGTTFTKEDSYDGDSNRCLDCAKWGHIYIENACPDCGESSEELEEIEAVDCPKCGETFPTHKEFKPEEVWKCPYKKHQKFVLKVPEFTTRPPIERKFKAPAYANVLWIDRKSRFIELDICMLPEGGMVPWHFTLEDIEQWWKPVSTEEFRKWLYELSDCSNCNNNLEVSSDFFVVKCSKRSMHSWRPPALKCQNKDMKLR